MKTRHLSAGILACALTLTLTACGLSGADVTTYIQGELDCTYKGQYSQEYLDLVDGMTEEDAQQQYEDHAVAAAQRLLSYLEVVLPTDAVNERATQLVKDIYAKAKYTVGDGNKLQGGDFAVEVTLSPIELFHLIPDETYGQVWTQVCEDNGTTPDLASTMSEEEYQVLDAEYALRMMEKVEEILPKATYGREQSVMLQLKLEGDYYSLVSSGWQTLDDMVIDYTGDYL